MLDDIGVRNIHMLIRQIYSAAKLGKMEKYYKKKKSEVYTLAREVSKLYNRG